MTRRWLAVGLWAAAAATIVVTGVVAVRSESSSTVDASADRHVLAMSPAALAFLLLGGLLLLRRPEQVFGWLLTASATLIGLSGIPLQDSGTESLGYRIGVILFVWFGVMSAAVIALFPTGRPLPGLWVWAPRLLVAGAIVLSVGWLLNVQPGPGRPVVTALGAVASVAYVLGFIGSLAMLVVRFVRSRGVERAQLKWFLLGVAVAGVLWVGPFGPWSMVGPVVVVATIVLAILRYRLYDIDRVISRTTSYAIVTGVVLATYLVVVATASRLLPRSGAFVVAGATLLAAAVFRPVLRRVQDVVDRRFNRSHYDAEQMVTAFGERLRRQVDPEQVVVDLQNALAVSLEPSLLTVTLVRRS